MITADVVTVAPSTFKVALVVLYIRTMECVAFKVSGTVLVRIVVAPETTRIRPSKVL